MRVGILLLLLILKEVFSFSPLNVMLAIGLPYMIIIMLRNVPSTPAVLKFFIVNGSWNLLNAFSASIEIIIWFLFFIFLMCFTLTDLWILNHAWITGINLTWSLCMIFLMYSWTLLLFYWWFFHLWSQGYIGYNFLVSYCLILVSGYAGLIKWVWKSFFPFYSFEEFEKNWYSTLNLKKKLLVNSFGSVILFVERFLIANSISLAIISLFRFCIPSWFNLGRLDVSMNLSIVLGCPVCWHIIVHSSLSWSFVFFMITIVISPL